MDDSSGCGPGPFSTFPRWLTGNRHARYHRGVSQPNDVMSALKELLAAGNPGLVTREDLARLEEKLDELSRLLDELERRLPDAPARPNS